jgi:hypothetical protein
MEKKVGKMEREKEKTKCRMEIRTICRDDKCKKMQNEYKKENMNRTVADEKKKMKTDGGGGE